MSSDLADIGLIGLGTMGANLSMNIADNGFKIAVFNRTTSTTHAFVEDAGELSPLVIGCDSLETLVRSIRAPRSIILMVPAGEIVDNQIEVLKPLLDENDLIIDAGNANFHDSNRRSVKAENETYDFLGIGVSGGEEGARYGPSIMGGGPKHCWDRVAPILEAISAKHETTPCATWMGTAGAGHFVKTVHNGIEYADMQMIAEAYGIMRDGMGMTPDQISETFANWDKGPLKSYLVEISGKVSEAIDDTTGKPVIDIILDKAGQKGTGRWTAIEALHLAAPATVIEAAVAARNLSSRIEQRAEGQSIFGPAPQSLNSSLTIQDLESALIAGKIMCYAQGFGLISAASKAFNWQLPLPEIAKVWRAGCIIRSSMLNDMAKALASDPDQNLMFAPHFANLLKSNHTALRNTVSTAFANGQPVPALAAGLSYFDIMRTQRSTANMIQAQRDFFGAHSFERLDKTGKHHGPWGLDN